MRSGSAAVVVLAGGSGTRVGAGVNKVYLPLAGRHVISWSLLAAGSLPEVGRLVLVIRPQDDDLVSDILAADAPGLEVEVVHGGQSRHASEGAAFAHLAPAVAAGQIDAIAVHDGARPLAPAALFRTVLHAAASAGAAIPTLAASDLLPVGPDDTVHGSGAGGSGAGELQLVRVQTPQAFRAPELLAAYLAADRDGFEGTDTASSVEVYSTLTVSTVSGSATNLKLTYAADLALAEQLLAASDALPP